jgi:hypothetical protein
MAKAYGKEEFCKIRLQLLAVRTSGDDPAADHACFAFRVPGRSNEQGGPVARLVLRSVDGFADK